jgi:POT family proton-dependent oligopeptide transporter
MNTTTAGGKQWFGHPRGLATLFFTEMWERFSYYGMRALLILYMVAPVSKGGLGFATEKGASVYGWYVFAVYAASIPGGWLADRVFGLYRAVLFGGIIIALGHFCMAFPSVTTFYLGLGLIVLGTGLLKPNVSSIVGTLYDEDDQRRDSGFSIFYMGINLGAFIAPLICGWLGQKVNWHWGFAAAGIGMTAGVIQYVAGRGHLESARARHARETNQEIVAEKAQHEAFTPNEWKRIAVIGILFLFATAFWGAFEQAGSSLTLFADRNTSTSLLGFDFPSSWFQSVQPLFIIILSGVFAWFWLKLGKREPSSPMKFVFGLIFVGLGFLLLVPAAQISQSQGVRVSPMWLVGLYFLHTVGELCLSPVGLSTVTKLAPPRIVGFMMGIWFMSISLGGKLGAWVAGYFDRFPLPTLFGLVAATTIGAGVVLITLVPTIRKLMGGVH